MPPLNVLAPLSVSVLPWPSPTTRSLPGPEMLPVSVMSLKLLTGVVRPSFARMSSTTSPPLRTTGLATLPVAVLSCLSTEPLASVTGPVPKPDALPSTTVAPLTAVPPL